MCYRAVLSQLAFISALCTHLYLSQSELPVTLGLGGAPRADGVALRWPSGKVTLLKDVDANQVLTVSEESDSVQRQPFPHRR